jgi:enoyl-CoA hydratase/carnithine racemase
MLYQSAALRLECSEQFATLWLDSPVLTRLLLHQLREAIDVMQRCRAAQVLVVRSENTDVFLTGPEFGEYTSLTSPESRRGFSRLGHDVLQQLAELSEHVTTVAFIEGACTNAGLELALACDFRLAVARPETRIGFDVMDRGMLPCWGATQRLPPVLGPRRALDLILGGELLPARAAKRIGLVDHAFGPRPAQSELWWFVADVQDHQRRPRGRGWPQRLRDALRPLPSTAGREEPARSLIDAVRVGWRRGEAAGYAAERAMFVEHGLHPAGAWRRQISRHIVTERREAASRRIGVTRLDEQGIRLAVMALAAGTSLAIDHAEPNGWEQFRIAMRRAVDDGWFNTFEAEQKLKQVMTADLGGCELVFLTGSDADQAADLFRLDSSDEPVLALSTPALGRIAASLNSRGRVVGVDFRPSALSRAAVEIIPTRWTDAAAVATLQRWLEHCGQWPVVAPVATPSVSVAA